MGQPRKRKACDKSQRKDRKRTKQDLNKASKALTSEAESSKRTRATRSNTKSASAFPAGTTVDVKFKGRWYVATVRSENMDCELNVQYEDGSCESGVELKRIRQPMVRQCYRMDTLRLTCLISGKKGC